MMSLTLGHLGPDSGVLSYMDDIIVLNSRFKTHLSTLEQLLVALHAAGLTWKLSKVQFGQGEIA